MIAKSMTTPTLTSVSECQHNETYPERRLRFSQSEVFERLATFLRTRETPLCLDSIATDPGLHSAAFLRGLNIDFATPEDVDFFVSTLGDKSLPGVSAVRTFTSEDGHVQIEAFQSHEVYVYVIDGGDASIVCVSGHAGAVDEHWAETFARCGVPVGS